VVLNAHLKENDDRVSLHVPVWMKTGFWACLVIAVAVVLRRVVALAVAANSGPPDLVKLDQVFASHAALTLAHILPALFFVLLTPFVFVRRLARWSWPERFLFPLGVVVGITAYAMSVYAVGGWTERSAVLVFNTLFLYSLARAWRYRQQGDEPLKTRWLLRAIGILLGIATTRPVMGVFFATSRLTHLTISQFFGIAFWIGFSINTIAVEVLLRRRGSEMRVRGAELRSGA
jgi:hypothetical protein